MKEIRSSSNELIKKTLQLRDKSRLRKKLSLCVAEGRREVDRAIGAGYVIEQLIVCPDLWSHGLPDIIDGWPTREIASVPPELYAKIALRGTTEGILALVQTPEHRLESLEIQVNNPLIMVVEAVQKPGNLGALLRTADAAGVDAVLIANPITDLYSPQCIRASLGAVFTRPIALASSSGILDWLRQRGIKTFCAALTASDPYYEQDFRGPTALVLGAEDTGLSEDWLRASGANILIPMYGTVDSLNLSVSAAVLIFEAVRQRRM